MTPRRREADLVRSYVITGGRAYPSRPALDPAALVTAADPAPDPTVGLDPDRSRLLAVCQGGALSVAETAAHTGLALSVTLVLVADLLDSGHLTAKATPFALDRPDSSVLREVLDGLRRLVV
jgi:hypothetical protein